MKIENILCLLPSTKKSWGELLKAKLGCPPIGICSISSYLNLHGYTTKIIDLLVESYNEDEFRKIIEDFNPQMIMISAAYTESYNMSLRYAKWIRDNFKNCIVVLGGAHVTFMPSDALKNYYVDYVILNEGECSIIELLEVLKYERKDMLRGVRGIAYKINGKIKVNEQREYIESLDSLPFPNLTALKLDRYVTPFTLVTSRGCPGDCIYCASRAMSGKRYRTKSAETVVTEFIWLSEIIRKNSKYIQNCVAIHDDSFSVDKVRLHKFCNYMIKLKLNDILWKCESRVDVLDLETLELMKRAGCVAIHFGIESGDEEVLKSLNKYITVKRAKQAVKDCFESGIKPLCSFIIGHHLDTEESVKKTLSLMREFKEKYDAQIACSPNTPLPGTYLYNNLEELGIRLHSKSWDDFSMLEPIISTNGLNRNQISRHLFEFKKICEQ